MTTFVLLHGFAGHADSWRAVRTGLPAGANVVALTAFGHDPETRPARSITFEDEVTRIVDVVRAQPAPVRLCGYSMGGRLALGVLARAPRAIASAVIIGAHPGLTSDEERRARAASDQVWIRVLLDEGIASFADKWQAQALFASQSRLPSEVLDAQRAVRVRHDARSLAYAMESLGLAAMPSYWDALGAIDVEVDLVVGSLDEKFKALATRMRARMKPTRAREIVIDDSGHNVMLEQPAALARILAQ